MLEQKKKFNNAKQHNDRFSFQSGWALFQRQQDDLKDCLTIGIESL